MFILGHVTLGNDPCSLCCNSAMKLQDKLEEKLPSVTAPFQVLNILGKKEHNFNQSIFFLIVHRVGHPILAYLSDRLSRKRAIILAVCHSLSERA